MRGGSLDVGKYTYPGWLIFTSEHVTVWALFSCPFNISWYLVKSNRYPFLLSGLFLYLNAGLLSMMLSWTCLLSFNVQRSTFNFIYYLWPSRTDTQWYKYPSFKLWVLTIDIDSSGLRIVLDGLRGPLIVPALSYCPSSSCVSILRQEACAAVLVSTIS